jgi:hypothetical protein
LCSSPATADRRTRKKKRYCIWRKEELTAQECRARRGARP